jgi:hypothetical protein
MSPSLGFVYNLARTVTFWTSLPLRYHSLCLSIVNPHPSREASLIGRVQISCQCTILYQCIDGEWGLGPHPTVHLCQIVRLRFRIHHLATTAMLLCRTTNTMQISITLYTIYGLLLPYPTMFSCSLHPADFPLCLTARRTWTVSVVCIYEGNPLLYRASRR